MLADSQLLMPDVWSWEVSPVAREVFVSIHKSVGIHMLCDLQVVWDRTPGEMLVCSERGKKKDKRSHLGGESTEKRSVIYLTAKQQEANILQENMEKIDATGPDAMFGDNNMNFDLKLKQFKVNVDELKEKISRQVFCEWVKDW
jgi:hypothetical protein